MEMKKEIIGKIRCKQCNSTNTYFRRKTNEYILLLRKTPKVIFCRECYRKINKDEKLFFCRRLRQFFHRECLIHSKHQSVFLSTRNLQHGDYPVIIDGTKDE